MSRAEAKEPRGSASYCWPEPRNTGERGLKRCSSPQPGRTTWRRQFALLLEDGSWVLSDRFVDSSLAYQGGAGGLGIETVREINAFGLAAAIPTERSS